MSFFQKILGTKFDSNSPKAGLDDIRKSFDTMTMVSPNQMQSITGGKKVYEPKPPQSGCGNILPQ